MEELFLSLNARWMPERVASTLLSKGFLSENIKNKLENVARHYRSSYMSQDFKNPSSMYNILNVSSRISENNKIFSIEDSVNLVEIDQFIEAFEHSFNKTVGQGGFKDRLNREERKECGLKDLSKRRYNRLYRTALRLEKKRAKLEFELDKRKFAQTSKSRLAYSITLEEFLKDDLSAAFIAYYTAKCNKRSLFTNSSQERPFDKVCEAFMNELSGRTATNWWAIALVYPDVNVLSKLTEVQKGELLGIWYGVLSKLASLLQTVWNSSNIVRSTMIVQRGNDSTNWNVLAGAWNKARDAWINLLYSMGMGAALDVQCPGKVLRLMAADVAYWHRATGGDLSPDTAVWNEVPLPWEVLLGNTECTKKHIENVCKKHKLDPYKSGWVGPKPLDVVHDFNPTPDLVHGVVVNNPELARLFRKAGVFSGKLKGFNTNIDIDEVDQVRQDHYDLIETKK